MELAKNWTCLDDEELIAEYRRGDAPERAAQAIGELFRRYQPRIARWCLRFTGNVETARDLAQDIQLKIYRSLHTFRGESRFATWLYTVVKSQQLTMVQHRSTQPHCVGVDCAESLADDRLPDLQRVVEHRRWWQHASRHLDRTEIRVVTMYYAEEMTLDEVTRHLGLRNKSGAKAYLVSARRKLNRVAARR